MKLTKIVWAVDALEETQNQTGVLALLGSLTKKAEAKIDPVFVMGFPGSDSDKELPTTIGQAYRALAEKRMLEFSKRMPSGVMKVGTILGNQTGSARKAAQQLVSYAGTENADAIVVATHARSGISRLLLGSFAEALVNSSTIPIITVNPSAKVRTQISKILFATTFQDRMRNGFEHAVRTAKAMNASLTLYYKQPFMPTAHLNTELLNFFAQEKAERAKQAEKWQAWSNSNEVQTAVEIDNEPGDHVKAISEFAAKGDFDMIAMTSEAAPVLKTLLGSVSRNVIRQAQCPVWVMKEGEE